MEKKKIQKFKCMIEQCKSYEKKNNLNDNILVIHTPKAKEKSMEEI